MAIFYRLLRGFKKSFDEHPIFWVMFWVGIAVFCAVPQVTNLWQQAPPFGAGILFWTGYMVFLVVITMFYVSSLFVVLGHGPIHWVLSEITAWTGGLKDGILSRCCRGILDVAASILWLVPNACCQWMVWAVSRKQPEDVAKESVEQARTEHPELPRPPGREFRSGLIVWGLVFVFLAMGLFWKGATGDGSNWYPLAGAGCRGFSGLCLLLGVWLLGQWWFEKKEMTALDLAQGRILGWFFATWALGELLWFLAGTEKGGEIISYRLYTIWIAVHSLALLILIALLVDRCHVESRWPARLGILVLLVGVSWFWSGAAPLSLDDFRHHLSSKEKNASLRENSAAALCIRNEQWFEHLARRIREIPEDGGPVVLVAASGGGSRAAIFTSLALDTFGRTPLDPTPPIFSRGEKPSALRSWADNIVLISSVSGGSLATAHYVHGLRAGRFPPELETLRNTMKRELVHRIQKKVERRTQNILRSSVPVEAPHDLRPGPDGVDDAYLTRLGEIEKKSLSRAKDSQESTFLELFFSDLWSDAYWRLLERKHGNEADLEGLFERYPKLDRYRWVLRQPGFDAMCMDFMAPILRGNLTPLVDRGDSLARFWTEQFRWHDCTNFNGYGLPLSKWTARDSRPVIVFDGRLSPIGVVFTARESRPLVIFNAAQVDKGSRLAIGFPALPTDLWKNTYEIDKVDRPCTLGEVHPGLRVSLARAVRMSSNFPWGFRVMELPSDGTDRLPTHVLDGGVVDNTGLDTLYHLFHALEFYAAREQAEEYPCYHDHARHILDAMRRRGVVILEIDSGAKPTIQPPRGPLAGLIEPTQALNNAAYATAEQTKRLYLDQIKRILARNVDDLFTDEPWVKDTLAPFREEVPRTTLVLHIVFNCNHRFSFYDPNGDDPQREDVMTAWTLGPGDKAEVVSRFLLQLGAWDDKREIIHKGVAETREAYQKLHTRAAEAVQRGRIERIVKDLNVIGKTLEELRNELKKATPEALEEFWRVLEDVERRVLNVKSDQQRLADMVEKLGDPGEYRDTVKRIAGQVAELDKRLRDVRETKTVRKEMLQSLSELSRDTTQSLRTLGSKVEQSPSDRLDPAIPNTQAVQRQLDEKTQGDRLYPEPGPVRRKD